MHYLINAVLVSCQCMTSEHHYEVLPVFAKQYLHFSFLMTRSNIAFCVDADSCFFFFPLKLHGIEQTLVL